MIKASDVVSNLQATEAETDDARGAMIKPTSIYPDFKWSRLQPEQN